MDNANTILLTERGSDGRVRRSWYKDDFRPVALLEKLDELSLEYYGADPALVYLDSRGRIKPIWHDEPNKINRLVKAVISDNGYVLGFVVTYGEVMATFPLEGPNLDLNQIALSRYRDLYKDEVQKIGVA